MSSQAPPDGFAARVWRSSVWVILTASAAAFAGVLLAVGQFGLSPIVAAQVLYVPVTVLALRFGPRVGAVAGLVGGILVWTSGDPSTALAIGATTTVALITVGGLIGSSVRDLTATHYRDLAAWWDSELAGDGATADWPRLLTDAQVRQKVESEAFYPVFQPIYALADGRLLATEALTRFDSDPPVPPSHWFAHAAQLGLGTTLELLAIRNAIASARGLPPNVALSVNASAATLVDPRLVAMLAHTNRGTILELTELEPVTDYHGLHAALARLRAVGAKLAVVNVGASLTSLRHVGRLAPEIVKLDSGLISEGRDDPVRWALTKRLLRHARATDTMLIVDCIEDAEELQACRDLGVQAVQGYLLGRPGSLTFPHTLTFPTPRGNRRRVSTGRRAVHPRDRAGSSGLSLSQLGEDDFYGRDRAP